MLTQAGASSKPKAVMLWETAAKKLELPAERISSRWLGKEALMLASAPYKSTADLVADLQMAAIKRLLPQVDSVSSDAQLEERISSVTDIYEDTVYSVAKDVIKGLESYAQAEKAVTGTVSLHLLSVQQSIKEHLASLVHPGYIAETPAENLSRIDVYCQADLMRLQKAKANASRDVQWAWEAEEAHGLVDRTHALTGKTPAGPQHDQAVKTEVRIRWMYEEFRISLWAQELGTPHPISLQRMKKALAS